MTTGRFFRNSASILALIAFGQAAHAQDAAAADTDIIVTGIRASQAAAIETKRNSDVIVDAISAEDIGKFPDRNVAESLQRVPGVVINREYGEGERVNVRGTDKNLTRTLLNGHGIATADWFILDQQAATRSFNFLMLPSEIVGKLEVYKSPMADLDEGGVGATINVETRRPLDLDAFSISGSAQMVYSERADKFDPQFSGMFSWKNDDESFGVLVGGVYQKRRLRRDGVEVLSYITPVGQPTGDALVPGLIGSALFTQDRERYGGNLAVQFRPSDTLEINVTGLYSRLNANNFNQNFMAWGDNALGGGGTLTDATVVDGTVVKGTITSADNGTTGRAAVFDAISRKAYTDTWSADFDAVWHASDRGTAHFQIGYTKAIGATKDQPFYEGGAPGSFTFDLTGRTPQVSFTGFDPTDPNDMIFDFASFHSIRNKDQEFYAYADYEHELDMGVLNAIKVGAKFTNHDRDATFMATTYGGFYMPLAAEGCNGGPCTSADFAGELTPGNFLKNIKLPGTFSRYWQVDQKKLDSIYFSQPESVRQRIPLPSDNYSINEKTYGGFAMAKLGGEGWKGNFGVRVIRTDQTTDANLIGVLPETPGAIDNPFGTYLPVSAKRSYTDILPSANLNIDLNDKMVVRFAAGRTMARPDYTNILPRVTLNPGALSGEGGDPDVKPFRANQYDISFEWYPERDTIVAAALFYKDIQSYIVNETHFEVYPVETATPNGDRCVPAPGTNPNLYNCEFAINRASNGGGGTNKGFELQVSRPIWHGFGAIVNYTYSDAKADDGQAIPGNSKHTYNLTGYYEDDVLSARLSYTYRSKFFVNIDRGVPLNQKSTASLDASVSVNVTENIAITADAINLTNQKIEQYSGTTVRPRGIYDNGRQFYFGARFKY